MGGGAWSFSDYTSYSTSMGRSIDSSTMSLTDNYSAQDLFTASRIQKELNPYNVMRECCDSEEHPNTVPVILALDVTGSMGEGAAQVAKKLNNVMTELYKKVEDVEFMIMGIGDLSYDEAPIQISQFESDIRIAEQLDRVYFERGGGGNRYESYTAAWYMGLRHAKLDCWERGKKGIIITMGDEYINPFLPATELSRVTGDKLQGDVETDDLYKEVVKKYDVYHIAVDDALTSYKWYKNDAKDYWGKYFDDDHFLEVSIDSIAQAIINIVSNSAGQDIEDETNYNENGEISW